MREIRLDLSGPVAELVLDRPSRRNAISQAMWAAIPELIGRAVSSSDIKALIIHGGSSGHFAAGADISEFESVYATPDSTHSANQTISVALNAIEHCPKPVIAAIEGNCIGGGVSLAMASDLRFASDSSQFGITPARLGLLYPPGDTRRLLQAVGASTAKDLLFSGRILPAREALSLRLVDRLVPSGTAVNAARDFAGQMASVSQWTVRATKKMIQGLQSGWTETGSEVDALMQEGFSNPDFREGVRAFLEKRKPDFPVD